MSGSSANDNNKLLQDLIKALQALDSALSNCVQKVDSSDTPGYLQSISISRSSGAVVNAIKTSTRAAKAASSTVTDIDDDDDDNEKHRQGIIQLCTSTAQQSDHINKRVIFLKPRLKSLGVISIVRRDLQAVEDAVNAWLEVIPKIWSQESKDMQSVIHDIKQSKAAVASEFELTSSA